VPVKLWVTLEIPNVKPLLNGLFPQDPVIEAKDILAVGDEIKSYRERQASRPFHLDPPGNI
jgi:hypothetical protein